MVLTDTSTTNAGDTYHRLLNCTQGLYFHDADTRPDPTSMDKRPYHHGRQVRMVPPHRQDRPSVPKIPVGFLPGPAVRLHNTLRFHPGLPRLSDRPEAIDHRLAADLRRYDGVRVGNTRLEAVKSTLHGRKHPGLVQ